MAELTFERFLEDVDLVIATHRPEELKDYYRYRTLRTCQEYGDAVLYAAGAKLLVRSDSWDMLRKDAYFAYAKVIYEKAIDL